MEKIIRNGREFLRFKIGDEYKAESSRSLFSKYDLKKYYNGDITYNGLKKAGFVNDLFDKKNGFIYPFMDSSTQNNHIKGYSKIFNFSGRGIKVSESGDAGKSILIEGKYFIGRPAYVLTNDKLVNSFTSNFLNKLIPNYKQTSVISNVMYSQIEDEYIEIPSNHEELSKIIKRINEYKQLSKQLSKQMEEYKKAILQESEKSIKYFKESGQHDKYISFKIGDEFTAISGKGSFNKMKLEGLCSDEYNKELGFIYPFYDASTKNNHIKGYCKEYNLENASGIKVSVSGASAGKSRFSSFNKVWMGEKSYMFKSQFSNYFIAFYLSEWIPNTLQTSAIPNAYFSNYNMLFLDVPINHKELSKKIEQINKWQIQVNETTKKMEKYIDGVLQMSLK